MDLGHGFLPRVDARSSKAVERCLTRDGPGLWHEALDVPWVAANLPPLFTEHVENHLGAASFFAGAISEVA